MSSRHIAATIAFVALGAAPALAAEPAAGTPTVFAGPIGGPEGIATTRTGDLVVGTENGELLRIDPAGTVSPIATIGDRLAGITVLADGRILACAFSDDRVWVVDAGGTPSVLASGIDGPNFAAQERRQGRIYVSASNAGTIVDVTTGTPVVVASGLEFPNGLAIGKEGSRRYLYVAETFVHRIRRIFLNTDGSLGAIEPYATGTSLADGIAFDRRGNLLVVGADTLSVVDRTTHAVTPLLGTDAVNWPSNLTFGRRGRGRRTLFLAQYGLPLGSGTDVLAVPYSIRGARVIR